jgi:hypothetical protein
MNRRELEKAYATHYLDKEATRKLRQRAVAAEEKKQARLKPKEEKHAEERDAPEYGVEHWLEVTRSQAECALSHDDETPHAYPSDGTRPTSILSNNPWKDDDLPF